MAARLIEREHSAGRRVFSLSGVLSTLGRSFENSIVVESDRVSRQHAEIRYDGSCYVLKDLGSRNGTFLNGRRISAPQTIVHGDIISLAGVTFVLDATEQTAEWRPEVSGPQGIRVDHAGARVWLDETEVATTAKEYLALALLYSKAGSLVSKEELARAAWPEFQGAVSDDSIVKLVERLRKKIEINPANPKHLLTVRGLGYRLQQEGPPPAR